MKIYQVDSFTEAYFSGNPAGVCILSESKSDLWMQKVAQEMNLSETAFLSKTTEGYNLRWFTPESEVDLCGHATLASAHILWETNRVNKNETIKFNTNSGILKIKKRDDWIEMNFPLEKERKTKAPDNLIKSLEVTPKYVGKNRFDYLIEVESEKEVKNIEPDFNLLKKVDTRGVIVTARAKKNNYDFVSRFFAPRVGVDEDPVTGSAHCCLGYYWKKRINKNKFLAFQLSKRGGIVKVEVLDENRIKIAGKAVTIFSGNLYTD